MCRRPLAGFFSRMCTGTPMASPNCPAAAQTRQTVWMSLLQPARQTESPCCLCPVSGHALRAVQPASESACSFLFLQPSAKPSVHSFLLYTFCTPSVRLLYTFCTFCTCLDAPQTLLCVDPDNRARAVSHARLSARAVRSLIGRADRRPGQHWQVQRASCRRATVPRSPLMM